MDMLWNLTREMFGRGDHGWNDKFLSPKKEMEKVNHLYEIKSKTWQSIELNYQAFILHGWLTNRISHDDAAQVWSLNLKSLHILVPYFVIHFISSQIWYEFAELERKITSSKFMILARWSIIFKKEVNWSGVKELLMFIDPSGSKPITSSTF